MTPRHFFALLALLASLAPGSVRAALTHTSDFTGSYTPANWAVQTSLGFVDFSGSPTATQLILRGPAVSGEPQSGFAAAFYQGGPGYTAPGTGPGLPEAVDIWFNWAYNAQGSSSAEADLYWDGGSYTFKSGQGTASGSFWIRLDAGQHPAFVFTTDTPALKSSGFFTISQFEVQTIPEAGTWVAGAFLLAFALGQTWRMRRKSSRTKEQMTCPRN